MVNAVPKRNSGGWGLLRCVNSGRLLTVLLCLLWGACVRSPLEGPEDAFRRTEPPRLSDDLPIGPLVEGVRRQIRFLREPVLTPAVENTRYVFDGRELTRTEYLNGLERFVMEYEAASSKEEFLERVREGFDFYEVYGDDQWGRAFMTSYYEPVIPGSRNRTKEFSRPLYAKPGDIIEVNLREFFPVLSPDDPMQKLLERLPVIRGRIHKGPTLRGNRELVPYYSREEIDEKNALAGKAEVLAWVRPLDAFFLQIQGSGTVRFDGDTGGEIRVGYEEQNGHPYVAVGRHLTHAIPLEEMSLHTIEEYLESLSPEDRQAYLNLNPSYVFFRELEGKPVTYMGTPVVEGRTIATDPRYFPKGALGFLRFEKPVFAGSDSPEPSGWEPTSRLVIDQDKGGAIRGGGRLDLFWGSGRDAKRAAGVMKQWVKLYYLAPKPEWTRPVKKAESVDG